MPDPFARSLSAIDCEMRNLATLDRDAAQQLDHLRQQITELQHHEYNLVCAIEGRRAKYDLLLDERLRHRATDQMPTGHMT